MMVFIVGFCFCIFGFTAVAHADGDPQVKASAPATVSVGQQFRLTYTSNERLDDVQLPGMSAFTLLGGPSTSFQSGYQSTNGKTTSYTSYTYTYYLQADKEGDWEIPAATVKAGGKSYKSNAVRIHVSKGGGGAASGGGGSGGNAAAGSGSSSSGSSAFNKNDFFVKAEVSKTNPYVEEEVMVHYKLYVPAGTRFDAEISKMPAYNGCWSYDLGDRNARRQPYRENYNGKPYAVVDLFSVALYPQKAGTITISPLEVEMVAQIVVQRQRSNDPFEDFFGMFGGQNVQNIRLNPVSKSITLQVKPLPTANRPADFSGLVGSFSMRSELTRNTLKANDATNFSIVISGKGNLQHVETPQLVFPSDLDVHDPAVCDKINADPKSGVSGSRTFEYILIPREAGDFDIPQAAFCYFDPVKKQYVTIHSNAYPLKVEKGDAVASNVVSSRTKKDVKDLGKDIRFIRTEVPHWRKAGERLFFLSPVYWVLLGLPLLLFVLFLLLLGKRIRDQRNVVMVKDRKASKVARKRLKTAAQYLKSGDDTRFYEEISRVLWGYVGDKFHLPKGELSLDAARQKLEERHMRSERIDEFVETLNQCEYARFAPSKDWTPEKMYEKTFSFITNMEAGLKAR